MITYCSKFYKIHTRKRKLWEIFYQSMDLQVKHNPRTSITSILLCQADEITVHSDKAGDMVLEADHDSATALFVAKTV